MVKVAPEVAATIIMEEGSTIVNGSRVVYNPKIKTIYLRKLNRFERNPEEAVKVLKDYLLTEQWMAENGCTGLTGWTMYRKPNGEVEMVPAVAACVGEKRRKPLEEKLKHRREWARKYREMKRKEKGIVL